MKGNWVFVCYLAVALVTLEPGHCQGEAPLDSERAGEIAVQLGKAKISVDPRMELLAVVQSLAKDPIIRKSGPDGELGAYSRDIEQHFSKFQAAPVVRLYQELRTTGFSFGRVPELTVRLDANLKLEENSPGLADYVRKSGVSPARLNQFVEALARFRRDSTFDSFFTQHAPYYRALTAKVEGVVEKTGALVKLSRFYGYEQNSYQITLYPLANGGFADRVPGPNGRYAVYVFATVPTDEAAFVRLLLHEIGHSFTGPLAYTTYGTALNQYCRLFEPIEASMKRQNYHSWINCVDEHVNRAVTARLLKQIYGNEAGQREVEGNQKRDFIYTEAIYQRLAEYEQNRVQYPNFERFYPEIVKLFGELAH